MTRGKQIGSPAKLRGQVTGGERLYSTVARACHSGREPPMGGLCGEKGAHVLCGSGGAVALLYATELYCFRCFSCCHNPFAHVAHSASAYRTRRLSHTNHAPPAVHAHNRQQNENDRSSPPFLPPAPTFASPLAGRLCFPLHFGFVQSHLPSRVPKPDCYAPHAHYMAATPFIHPK